MSQSLQSPYASLVRNLAQLTPVRAVSALQDLEWTFVYGLRPLELNSWALADPTGEWVMKVSRSVDPGYFHYAKNAAEMQHVATSHVPHVEVNMECNNGILTLMKRLKPLRKFTSRLMQNQQLIAQAVALQFNHITFKQRQWNGIDALLREMLDNNDDLIELVAVLTMSMLFSRCELGEWKRNDIMCRDDGTEVLLDPFSQFPSLELNVRTA